MMEKDATFVLRLTGIRTSLKKASKQLMKIAANEVKKELATQYRYGRGTVRAAVSVDMLKKRYLNEEALAGN